MFVVLATCAVIFFACVCGKTLFTQLMHAFLLCTATLLLLSTCCWADTIFAAPKIPQTELQYADLRPPINQRRFVSPIIEQVIANVSSAMKDKVLASIFANSFPNTLDTTVETWSDQDTFIITGDIKAMWLRDSTNQIYPYLPYVSKDANLQKLVQGLVRRQVKSILIDPYANAFYHEKDMQGVGEWQTSDQTFSRGYLGSRVPAMTLKIHERKYEVDSLCAVLKLSNGYYLASNNDTSVFDTQWQDGMNTIIQTLVDQQKSVVEEQDKYGPSYWFSRTTNVQTETLKDGGQYCSISARTGMVKTAFRPSDDACTYPYNVPQNAMCVVELNRLATIIQRDAKLRDPFADLATRAQQLAHEIDGGIRNYGIVSVKRPEAANLFAFEVDGYNSFLLMDDGNIPSVLSLPYLGYVNKADMTYLETRKYLLSLNNPYYFKGSSFAGVGSPHTGYGNIWPMSIIIQALTSTSDDEIVDCLRMLRDSSNGLIHESFNRNNPNAFTRSWFGMFTMY